jgi:hypothetical protein
MTTRLFKGAARGTHWHTNDARLNHGFSCLPAMPGSVGDVIRHIVNFSFPSPFTSFTSSFAVAQDYAMLGPGGVASAANPGYVYEIDITRSAGFNCGWVDPLHHIVRGLGQPHHLHNGGQGLIHAIASGNRSYLSRLPPQLGNSARPHHVTDEMTALIYAIRDAEILARLVPVVCIVDRHDVS